MDRQERGSHRWFLVKIFFIMLLCLADLGLNSSVSLERWLFQCPGHLLTGFTLESRLTNRSARCLALRSFRRPESESHPSKPNSLFLCPQVEFDDFVGTDKSENSKNILVLVFGLQLVVQISTFLLLFLMMGDTYLFRVGLLGVLAKQVRSLSYSHPKKHTFVLTCPSKSQVRWRSHPASFLYCLHYASRRLQGHGPPRRHYHQSERQLVAKRGAEKA